jgi:hypothetical protein
MLAPTHEGKSFKLLSYIPDRADTGHSFDTGYEDGRRMVQLFIRKKDLAKPVLVVTYGQDLKTIRQNPGVADGYLDFAKLLADPTP